MWGITPKSANRGRDFSLESSHGQHTPFHKDWPLENLLDLEKQSEKQFG